MIRAEAKDFLNSIKGHWPEIERETGITSDWISKFTLDRNPDPRVSKFEKILQYARSKGWEYRHIA